MFRLLSGVGQEMPALVRAFQSQSMMAKRALPKVGGAHSQGLGNTTRSRHLSFAHFNPSKPSRVARPTLMMFNRGPSADQVIKAAHQNGYRVVQVVAKGDEAHSLADKVITLNKEGIGAYMDFDLMAKLAQAEQRKSKQPLYAHPGWGGFSENSTAMKVFEDAGIKMVAPSAETIEKAGSKASALALAKSVGVPVVPFTDNLKSLDEAIEFGREHGYPLALVASGGGGGKGMRRVGSEAELIAQFETVKSEAKASFGDDRVLVKRFLEKAQHIEVQIISDEHGNVLDLGEENNIKLTRDCSVQRRYQKVIERAPSSLDPALADEMVKAAIRFAKAAGYQNLGTVEFLFDPDTKKYYFLEMNTRLQVENRVTSLALGIEASGRNLVDVQLDIAAGKTLKEIFPNGVGQGPVVHAMQMRLISEELKVGPAGKSVFQPNAQAYDIRHFPLGERMTGSEASEASPLFDSTTGIILATGESFNEARNHLRSALDRTCVPGTNIGLVKAILDSTQFETQTFDVDLLPKMAEMGTFARQVRDPETNTLENRYRVMQYLADIATKGPHTKVVNEIPRATVPVPSPDKSSVSHVQKDDEGFWAGSFGQTWSKAAAGKEGYDARHSGSCAVVQAWLAEVKAGKLLLGNTEFRDVPQSNQANRMFAQQQVASAYFNNLVGWANVEIGGGASTHVDLKFLNQDPLQRTLSLQGIMPNHISSGLFRADSALAYGDKPLDTHTLEDVYRMMVVDGGLRQLRVFHAMNDPVRLEKGVRAAAKTGAIVEICAVFHPNHSTEDYVNLLEKMYKVACEEGAEGRVVFKIKDAQGRVSLTNLDALKEVPQLLASRLGQAVVIGLHTHNTAGQGPQVIQVLSRQGFATFDVAPEGLATQSTQPPVHETIVAVGPDRVGIKLGDIHGIARHHVALKKSYAPYSPENYLPGDLSSSLGVPPGMTANVYNQFEALVTLNKLNLTTEQKQEKFIWFLVLYNLVLDDVFRVTGVTPNSKDAGEAALFLLFSKGGFSKLIGTESFLTTEVSALKIASTIFDPLVREQWRNALLDHLEANEAEVLKAMPVSVKNLVSYKKGVPPFGLHPRLEQMVDRLGWKSIEPATALSKDQYEADIQAQLEKWEKQYQRPIPRYFAVLARMFSVAEVEGFLDFQGKYGTLTPGLPLSAHLKGIVPGQVITFRDGERDHAIRCVSISEVEPGKMVFVMQLDNGPLVTIKSQQEKSATSSATGPAKATDPNTQQGSPQPGRVVDILKERGQYFIVIEAMKMQTKLPLKPGFKPTVQKGDNINTDDLIAVKA